MTANLEDLYREIILDHYRSPRNRGELSTPPAHRVEGFNPLCGDEVVAYLEVRDGVLVDIKTHRSRLFDLTVLRVAHERRGEGSATRGR